MLTRSDLTSRESHTLMKVIQVCLQLQQFLIPLKIGIVPNYQIRPFETLDKLFWFRDSLAHARSETVRKSGHKERINWSNPDVQALMQTEAEVLRIGEC